MTNAIQIPLPATRSEWLKARRSGIGGSDVGVIVGVSNWRTPVQLWQDKLGESEENEEETKSLYWGKQLENLVAKEFQTRMGMKVQRVNQMIRTGENGWMIANIDRAIVNPAISGNVRVIDEEKVAENDGRRITTDAILECKTAHAFAASEWGPTQEYEIKKNQLVSEHEIPPTYEAQVQWYMAITGAAVCYLAVLIGGNDFRVYHIQRNEELIKALIEECHKFWTENVLANKAPEPKNLKDVKRLFKVDDGEMIEASNDIAADIGEFVSLKEKTKALEEQQKALATKIANALGDGLGFNINGIKALTFKTQTRRDVDSVRLRKEEPALYQKYLKVTTNRVLKTF